MKAKFRIFKDELSVKDIWAFLILLCVLLMSYIYSPTLDIANDTAYLKLKELYDSYKALYTLFICLILSLCSAIIYFAIKVMYIQTFKNYYFIDEMYSKYIDFLSNAKKIYIFGGDLHFLLENKEQFELIKRLGKRCKILCDVNLSKEKKNLCNIFVQLDNAGVQMRNYKSDISNKIVGFRGQMKIDDSGIRSSLFVKKIESTNKYKIVDLNNQFVTDLLYNEFEDCFKSGTNIFIKHILVDLGGVYFDGNFKKDFLSFVNSLLKTKINVDRKVKLMLDSELNLGNSTIINWIENKINKQISDDDAKQIESKWSNTWRPNSKMEDLVKVLKNTYNVTVISNLDKQNGEMYHEKGYFNNFNEPLFLSYKYKITKPDPKFWTKVCHELKAMPNEILVIDDHEENIKSAKKYGMNAIKFCIEIEDVNKLVAKLKELNIDLYDYNLLYNDERLII